MHDDPFLTFVVEALNLMHPRFALANGRAYRAEETETPPAVRKVRERSILLEFYHEVRHLWDRAFPVALGLGHIVVQGEPELGVRTPDLLFCQLGEQGLAETRLGAVSLALLSNPDALRADRSLLGRFRESHGYRYGVSVAVGTRAELPAVGFPSDGGVVTVFFELDRWSATVESGLAH